jgi:hypothetical protein
VSDIAQLAEKTPNVTFKFTAPISGASNAATVFIRGIGQSDFALTTDPGVGTYVDGVYVSRSVGGVLDVLDLKRVEVQDFLVEDHPISRVGDHPISRVGDHLTGSLAEPKATRFTLPSSCWQVCGL